MRVWYLRLPRRYFAGYVVLVAMLLLGSLVIGSQGVMEAMAAAGLGPVFRGRADRPVIALTCNVVWGEEFVPHLLDTLQAENCRMTFYLGGRWAEENPALVLRMVKEGHELGNHGYDHRHHQNLDKAENQKEILKAEAAIKSVVPVELTLFAPPYGEFNKTIVAAAGEIGYRTMMWSIDPVDWKQPGVGVIINRVLGKAHNGALVLLHPTAQTVEALPAIIKGLRKQGYTLEKVTAILE